MATQTAPGQARASGGRQLLVPLAAGAAVAVTLGVYGRVHSPTGIAVSVAGFSGPQTVKVWLASAATFFAVLQVISALVMYGKVPGVRAPRGQAPFTVGRGGPPSC